MKKYLLSFVCASAILAGAWNAKAAEASEAMPEPAAHHEMAKRPPHHGQMKKMHEDLAKKLELTDEQKTQAEKIREEGREKMKPLMDEMKEVHQKMEKLRKENMAEFEKILTPEQQKKFNEIKKEMEKHRLHKRPFGPKGGFNPEKIRK